MKKLICMTLFTCNILNFAANGTQAKRKNKKEIAQIQSKSERCLYLIGMVTVGAIFTNLLINAEYDRTIVSRIDCNDPKQHDPKICFDNRKGLPYDRHNAASRCKRFACLQKVYCQNRPTDGKGCYPWFMKDDPYAPRCNVSDQQKEEEKQCYKNHQYRFSAAASTSGPSKWLFLAPLVALFM